MDHVKDCIRLVPGNGGTDKADHAAMRPVTPYDSLAWTTAVAIVRERVEALKKYQDKSPYFFGRYEMACDILAEMEERGKP